MDQRKIKLDPNDLKKLKALLKEEEARVDALSEAGLRADELALEGRIRDFARGHSVGDPSTDTINMNWEEIRQRMDATSPTAKDEQLGRLVPFQAKKRPLPWTTVGGIAVAAVALLVFYPLLRKTPHVPVDYAQQTKGLENTAAHANASASFCDVNVTGKAPESVEESANGQSYIVTPSENFDISVLCDTAGFIQLWSLTPPATEFRNVPVLRNVRTSITQEDLAFKLKAKAQVSYRIALTNIGIGTDINLFEIKDRDSALEPEPAFDHTIGSAHVLWSDSINVKGK